MAVGLFTTLRVARGRALFWADHVARLRVGSPALDPGELLSRVRAAASGFDDARVRITLRPPEPPLIEARAYAPPGEPWRLQPVAVSHAGDGPLLKTTDRSRYEEARRALGRADDALLVGPSGEVLETTIANVLFLLPRGGVVTPPRCGILPGIARGRLLPAAKESRLDLEAASGATACVVTNALLLVHPVASIEGVREYDSEALARDLRETLVRMDPDLRIIQRYAAGR